jgi:hypothetical protein
VLRSGVVNDADAPATRLEHGSLGQAPADRDVIDVAPDADNRWPDRLEHLENLELGPVAGVDDQLGRREQLQALLRQRSPALRHVGIGDDRDQPRGLSPRAAA